MGACPEWYPRNRAARHAGVPPDWFDHKPAFYLARQLAAMEAEAHAAEMKSKTRG
jgi:hypothetical protein